jgi:hypothetical protein
MTLGMDQSFKIPPSIDAVILAFDESSERFAEYNVCQKLSEARKDIKNPTEEESFWAWVEILAFTLQTDQEPNPWSSYFGPMGSMTTSDGRIEYLPDIAHADARVPIHWAERARTLHHPLLKARYADLVWDLGPSISSSSKRDHKMARIAIDAYLQSIERATRTERIEEFHASIRALDLAMAVNDKERVIAARNMLLALHRKSVSEDDCLWWFAFNRLALKKNSGVDSVDCAELVRDLESLLSRCADVTNKAGFDPHSAERLAESLVKFYTRTNQTDEIPRIQKLVGDTLSKFAGIGDSLLAAFVLPGAIRAYEKAGDSSAAKSARIVLQDKVKESRAAMKPVEFIVEIPAGEMESQLESIILDDPQRTLIRLAAEFVEDQRSVEEQIRASAADAPLSAHLSQTIFAEDHMAGIIGSVVDDPRGRAIHTTSHRLGVRSVLLQRAMQRAIETHAIDPGGLVAWANRLGLFEDTGLLRRGIEAWFLGDWTKAVHVLIPQVEHGLRRIVGSQAMPTTKAHSAVPGVSVAMGMGDILNSEEIEAMLSKDIVYYFLALYADPRGQNLRNRVCHGLIRDDQIEESMATWVIHSLIVLGTWSELADDRRSNR